MIKVMITDTGPGIPETIQNRLFKKPIPSKEHSSNAGFGLWLSKLTLQSMGGNVEIEHTDSSGTTMLITIPISEAKKE